MTAVTANVKPLQAPYTVEMVANRIDEAEKLELSIMLVRIFRLMNTYDQNIEQSSINGEYQANFKLPDTMMGFRILIRTSEFNYRKRIAPKLVSWYEVNINIAMVNQIFVGGYMLPPIGGEVDYNEYYSGHRSDNIQAMGKAIESGGTWPAYSEDELTNELIEFYEDYLA